MPEPEVYARRLVRGSAIIFTALVLSGFVAFFLRMGLARWLVADDIAIGVKEGYHYGLFYSVFFFMSFLVLFRDLGFRSALVKYIPEFSLKKRFDSIKSSLIFSAIFESILAFSIAAIIFVFSSQISVAIFGTEEAILPLRILCVWFFFSVFAAILSSAFQGFQNMLAYASMSFFMILAVLIGTVLLVGTFGMGIGGVAFSYLIGTLVVIAFGLTYFWRRYQRVFKEKMQITRPLIKKLFIFAMPVFIGGLGGLIIGYTDTLMITVFRSLPEVGFYQVAQPTARVLWCFAGGLTIVFFPMVSELWARRERRTLSDALHFLTKFSFVLSVPAALVFIAFPGIIIRLLFREEYLAGATALQILTGAAIVYTLYAILTVTMAGIGKPIINTKVVGMMAGLNFILNLLLIPLYGIEGAATASFCSYALGLFLMFFYARKYVKFRVPASPMFKTLVGGILTLGLIFGLKFVLVLPPWPEAFTVVIPSLAFYGMWILVTKAIRKEDLRLITRIVPMPRWLVRVAGRFIGS